MEAVEKLIKFDERRNSLLSFGNHFSKKKPKVVVLFEDEETDELSWMKLGSKGQSFDFWNNPSEDIYTLAEGQTYKRKHYQVN